MIQALLRDDDILDSLVTELEILLHGDVVLNLKDDNGSSNYQRSSEAAPGRTEKGHIRGLETIEPPEDGSTGRLDTLVETCVHSISNCSTACYERVTQDETYRRSWQSCDQS